MGNTSPMQSWDMKAMRRSFWSKYALKIKLVMHYDNARPRKKAAFSF